MKRPLVMLAIVVSTALTVAAQERQIALWGHVFDEVTHHAVRDAKATLMTADSTAIDSTKCSYSTGGYYGTDANYRFLIPRRPALYIIKVEHPDYNPCFVSYEVKTPGRNTYFDAPWHYLTRRPSSVGSDSVAASLSLNEVLVRGTRIKMVYRNDTIVYDASAFQLPEGSMLDALVRQMPGVELKADGTILVNGEKVDYLTLNGKDFFKGKNKVMLENLPLYAVDKVKVYRKSTEKSEWLGREVEQKDFVMDVHLKREYNEGYMANAEAAGWHGKSKDDNGHFIPYTARLFGLRFTDASRIALFANANNVNEMRSPGQNGEWSPAKSLDNGLNKTLHTGLDVRVDDKRKRWDNQLRTDVERHKKEWESRELSEVFATGGNKLSTSHEWGGNRTFNAGIGNRFRWKDMFSPLKLSLVQLVNYGNGHSNNHGETATWTGLDTLNRSRFGTVGERRYEWLLRSENSLNYRTPWGDDLELTANLSYQQSSGNNEQTNTHYDYPRQHRQSDRSLVSRLPSTMYSLSASLAYTIHALNNWNYSATIEASQMRHSHHHHYSSFPPVGSDSVVATPVLLPDLANTEHFAVLARGGTATLRAYYTQQQDTRYTWLNLQLTTNALRERIDFHAHSLDTIAVRNYFFINPSISFMRNTARNSYELGLQSGHGRPDMRELIPIANTVDPLVTRLRNPSLKPSRSYGLRWKYRHTVPVRQQSLTLNGNVFVALFQIGNRQAYNTATGAYIHQQANIDRPQWFVNQEAHFNRAIDRRKRLTLEAHARLNYDESRAFALVQYAALPSLPSLDASPLVTTRTLLNSESLRLGYRLSHFEVTMTGNFVYRYAVTSQTILNIFDFDYGFTLNGRLPWDVHLAADARMYSRRGYQGAAMNTNDLVCNASLSKTFIKQLTVRLEAFDIFHQLKSTNYVLTASTRTETWRRSLPSYLMLHLAWQWSRLPKKK